MRFRSSDNSKNLDIFICIGIIFLTFAVYFQLSTHRFLSIDDPAYVTANLHVKEGLTFENFKWAFTTFDAEFWHPITWLSYMLDTDLFGVKPGGYLITNLVLHLLNSILLFYFLVSATKRTWESGFIAGLFALHPLHVEAVAWIAERKELLCGFFWMTTLIFYFRYLIKPDVKKYIFTCISFIFGIMSKPMIVTLPFVLLLLDFWPLNRTFFSRFPEGGFKPKSLGFLIYEKLPFFLISAVGSAVAVLAQQKGGGIVPISEFSLPARIASSVIAYVFYLKKTFWPIDLSIFYPLNPHPSLLELGISSALITAITIFCIREWKRFPYMAVGWVWFIGTLIPVIGIVKIGDFAHADRYTYIPLIGVFIMFAFGIRELVSFLRNQTLLLCFIPICVIGCFSWITFIQAGVWENSETLFSHAIEVNDQNYFAHYAMGNLKAGQGNFREAAYHFQQAVRIAPQKSVLWNDLGRAYFANYQINSAVACFSKSAGIHPDFAATQFYFGCALAAQGKYGPAVMHLFKALPCKTLNKSVDPAIPEYYKRTISDLGLSTSTKQLRLTIIRGFDHWREDNAKCN